MTAPDWTPARRLVQVRKALVELHLTADDRQALAEFADNIEKKYTKPAPRAVKGNV